jgi:archaellum component FlaG (FlaF/FlaG flagellin family)
VFVSVKVGLLIRLIVVTALASALVAVVADVSPTMRDHSRCVPDSITVHAREALTPGKIDKVATGRQVAPASA